jgi:hypothetical protein
MDEDKRLAEIIARFIRQALSQGDDTPERERLSFRVLAEETLPLLDKIAAGENVT